MCGIFAIVTKKPKVFDYSTFCTLGIANDSRGGDSCGFFIDGHYEYGVNKKAYFSEFFPTNDFLAKVENSTIAFGHCRKASVGKIDETTAQPVIIKNDKDEVEFVLMHNGTIYNYEELAKKYIPEINIKGMTDSQVMARIIYHKGFDVLEEYNGGAVFAITDYRSGSPRVFVFKGASKKTSTDIKEEEERPLWFCIDEENEELVFSSIGIYLMSLRPYLDTYCLNTNCVFEFTGKDLIAVQGIDRSKMVQKKIIPEIPKSTTTYYNRYYNNLYFGEDDFIFDDYVSTNQLSNTYSAKGHSLHGKVIISKWGRVCDSTPKGVPSKEIYFWNGVPLKEGKCFRFLAVLCKELKMDKKEFTKKFQNVIRFLSIDGVYCDETKWYKATSPSLREPYSGTIKMFTGTSVMHFTNGMKVCTTYTREVTNEFTDFKESKAPMNFQEIRKECKPLMK